MDTMIKTVITRNSSIDGVVIVILTEERVDESGALLDGLDDESGALLDGWLEEGVVTLNISE